MKRILNAVACFLLAIVLGLSFALGVGAQVNAFFVSSAGTAFGTAIGTAQTIVPAVGGGPGIGNVVDVDVIGVQSVLGVSCGAGTNTATPTLNFTGPGGTAKTLALSALSISANGALDTEQVDTTQLAVQMGSAITYTVASALGSAGCSPIPQYTFYFRTH